MDGRRYRLLVDEIVRIFALRGIPDGSHDEDAEDDELGDVDALEARVCHVVS